MCVTCGCNDTHDATLDDATRHDATLDDATRHGFARAPFRPQPNGFARAPFRPLPNGFARVPVPPQPPAPLAPPAASVPGRDLHIIELETQILGKNQAIAERNRRYLAARNILALNLVSAPGAGKTTLLERTLTDLKATVRIAVVEGDQATSNDAERIRTTGVPAVQVNTGTGCHLEADMLERAIDALQPATNSLLLIENVGNLVCPALFDLGERAKVVIFSVTEGEDKPLKYPHMFAAASVLLLSKMDLLPHIRFDVARALENALAVNPGLTVLRLSACTGEGLQAWYTWLRREIGAPSSNE
jgi:hydrogenase nickel incorporation protein HypB